MPRLTNKDNNTFLAIDLYMNNHQTHIYPDGEEWMSWIAFSFELTLDVETYKLPTNDHFPTFNLWELNKIINGFETIVSAMETSNEELINNDRFQPFEHLCSEVYFEIKVYETLEPRLINIELWLVMANFTNKNSYDKGFRFTVSLREFVKFTAELKKQFTAIKLNYG